MAFNSEDKGVQSKGLSADLVTATDEACENLIRSTIMEAFPDHKFIGEEEVAKTGRVPELGLNLLDHLLSHQRAEHFCTCVINSDWAVITAHL